MLSGHERAWREWREATRGPRMHHAWLLAGKRGLGKMHFALAAARALVGGAGGGGGGEVNVHPDIIVLTHLPKDDKEERKREEGKPYETRRNITVDQIRQMQARLTTRPTLGEHRVVIIDPADDLEKSASNALLKSLEEPPRGTHFILVSHRPGRLLPTLRSRCRVLRFSPLSEADVARILAERAPDADPATRSAAVAAAGGSPGAALEFVEHDLGALAALMQRLVDRGDPQFELRAKLAEAIGARPERDRLMAALDLARATVSGSASKGGRSRLAAIVEVHADLVGLAAQVPTYNFDAGLLAMEIGTLLARVAAHREPADA